VVEATKPRRTIFDFVFESPSSQVITAINLALLFMAVVNAASFFHDSLIGLNISLNALDHLVTAHHQSLRSINL
tara:strand:- start:111 stop:332 length:222 start_codon:yes stop_codon:yes gene_type:complete